MHVCYSLVFWDLKQGSNYVLFLTEVQKILVSALYGLGVGFLHSLPEKFPSKSDFHVTYRHSDLCLEAVVSDWHGGTDFPAVTKQSVLSMEMLQCYFCCWTSDGETDSRKLSARGLVYPTFF